MKRLYSCFAWAGALMALPPAMCASPALGATCATSAVTARGEESRYEWLAKTKARANWRRKVRALSDLGPAYSNWSAATDTDEKCLSGPAGSVCTFTGTPCKP